MPVAAVLDSGTSRAQFMLPFSCWALQVAEAVVRLYTVLQWPLCMPFDNVDKNIPGIYLEGNFYWVTNMHLFKFMRLQIIYKMVLA